MLQTIDILIGFAVVMLILSAVVTMLVQFVVTTLVDLKGRTLKKGIARLLSLLDKNGLTAAETVAIADDILRNALVGRKALFGGRWRLAEAIHREELATLILDYAAGADVSRADALLKDAQLKDTAPGHLRAKLLNSLRNNGVTERPADILKAVRDTMLALEAAQPELANNARQSLALLTHASSEFIAKLNAWFDQTIDRTVDDFTTRARVWTIIFGAAVALFFQVNSFELVRRLSVDNATREMLVSTAINDPDRFKPLPAPTAGQAPAAGGTAPAESEAQGNAVTAADGPEANAAVPADVSPTPNAAAAAASKTAKADSGARTKPAAAEASPSITPADALSRIKNDEELKRLVDADLITWPASFPAWSAYWTSSPSSYELLVRLLGILLTVSLLGLGAPVWYELLKNLINLRSVVSRNDDVQRQERQTSEPPRAAPAGRAGAPAAVAPARGERGDLEAVG